MKKAFKEAVDDYLGLCATVGKEPEKSYKGTFNIRVGPDLHKKAAKVATMKGIMLNQLVQEALRKEGGFADD